MKTFLILSLLVLSQTVDLEYTDVCGTEYKDDDSYLKICISDSKNADTDAELNVRIYYSSTSGGLVTSDYFKVDNVGCDDFTELGCDYFTGLPDDLGVVHHIEIQLEGTDGVGLGAIEVKYGTYSAQYSGTDNNDCSSNTGFGGGDYPTLAYLDADDICQSAVIHFADPDADGLQIADYTVATNGPDGTYCDCDNGDYSLFTSGAESGYCDSCYNVCNTDADCQVVTDQCGTLNKYNDQYVGICTSWHDEAGSNTDFMIRWNYVNTAGETTQNDYAEGDNMECDDFVTGKCDYFDDVPTDIATVSSVDIQKRGDDGWQFATLDLWVGGALTATFGGYSEQNECLSINAYYGWGADEAQIWVDEEDICQTVRIVFGDDGVATAAYAIEVCACDTIDPEYWNVGKYSGDYDSCFAQCAPDTFDELWGTGVTCDVVTVYSECDFAGESLTVEDSVDCLDWDPQSICVPEGISVTVYDLCWYDEQGGTQTFTDNESCMSDLSLMLLEQQGNNKVKKSESDKNARFVINK